MGRVGGNSLRALDPRGAGGGRVTGRRVPRLLTRSLILDLNAVDALPSLGGIAGTYIDGSILDRRGLCGVLNAAGSSPPSLAQHSGRWYVDNAASTSQGGLVTSAVLPFATGAVTVVARLRGTLTAPQALFRLGGSTGNVFYAFGSNPTGGNGFNMQLRTGGSLSWSTYDSEVTNPTLDAAVQAGAVLALTIDRANGDVQTYLNGADLTEAEVAPGHSAVGGTWTNAVMGLLCRNVDTSQCWSGGGWSTFRVWDRILSATELALATALA